MSATVTIYGKNSWPHTTAAREAYEKTHQTVDYISVIDDPKALQRMLSLSGGQRKIPVIVDQGRVSVGFKGKG